MNTREVQGLAPLRIAVVLPHLGVYGGVRRFFELARVWKTRGHQIAFLTPRGKWGVGTRDTWLPFDGELGDLDRLRGGSWDVVLSSDPGVFLGAESPGALRVFYAVGEKLQGVEEAWRRADLVLANSTKMNGIVRRHGVVPADGLGGVNLQFFSRPDPDPRRTAADAATGPIQILVYGRLSRPRKGTATAIAAIETAARRWGGPAELTLFDTPPPGAAVPGQLPLRIPHRWAIDPPQETLRDLYRSAHIFVSAERRGGWCNTVAEAMACGAAVVCTPGSTDDFARDGETALVARWPWRVLLAHRIQRLLRDPALRLRLADAGHRGIQAFGWERTAASVEAAIRQALAHRPTGSPMAVT